MQGTGRRSAPSLFAPLPRTGLCTKPCSGPRARLCSGPHGSHLLPPTVIAAPPLAPLPCRPHHRRSPRAVRTYSPRRRPHFRPHLRPPPVTSRPSPACRIPVHAFPRACRCPAAFFRTSGVCFAHVTQQMYAHLFNTLKINMLQSRQEKGNLLTESKLHFSGFPPSGTELPIRNLHDAFFCLYWRMITSNTLLT